MSEGLQYLYIAQFFVHPTPLDYNNRLLKKVGRPLPLFRPLQDLILGQHQLRAHRFTLVRD